MIIKEICEFYPKSKIKAGEGLECGEYPFYTSSSILSKYLDSYEIEKNGIILGTGGSASIHYNEGKFSASTDCLVMYSKDDRINTEYLYYYLLSNIHILEHGFRGAGLKHISKKYIEDIEIKYIPSVSIQKKIIEVIKLSRKLIDKRKEQIEVLDELVKSRFIEMFGDPVNNPKEWNKVNIGSKFEIKTGSTPSRKENTYWENGTIPWVKTTELKEVIINETEEYITQDGYDNSSVNLLPKETLLIAMYGQGKTRGMTGKLGIEATTNQACAAILPNSEENMDFVWYQLKLSYEDLRSLGRGGSQPNLNTNLIKSYELIFPPMKLQNQFVNFVNQVDKLKSKMETSLKELEDNFNSLMQKAFKGELF